MESLVSVLKDFDTLNFLRYKKIERQLINRIQKSNTRSKETGTLFGVVLAISFLFIPLGSKMFDISVKDLVFKWTGIFHWGFFWILLPVWIIVSKFFIDLCIHPKTVFTLQNWSFIQKSDSNKTTQSFLYSNDQSTIEFERYFNKILTVFFDKKQESSGIEKKLVIVIDNLDRVDVDDSLRIWSTLQTFLQKRNPSCESNYEGIIEENIWIIVPYDVDGLSKVWDKNLERKTIKKNTRKIMSKVAIGSCAKSFFDKCFQIRLSVPQLLLTDWTSFIESCIESHLIGIDLEENKRIKDEIIDILKITSNSSNADFITPRIIKIYLNQIGILSQICDKEISFKAIAYYVVLHYLKSLSNKTIAERIINGLLPESSVFPYITFELREELCGILFGVSPSKGIEILLTKQIKSALNNDLYNLDDLCAIHKEAFWTYFNRITKHEMQNRSSMVLYSSQVYKTLWKEHKEKCKEIFIENVGKLITRINAEVDFDVPDEKELDLFKNLLLLLQEAEAEKDRKEDKSNAILTNLWERLKIALETNLKSGKTDYYKSCKIYTELASLINIKFSPIAYAIPVAYWINWATVSEDNNFNSQTYIVPPYLEGSTNAKSNFIEEISDFIDPASPFPDGLVNLISYMLKVKKGSWNWIPVIEKIQLFSATKKKEGMNDYQILTDDVIRILTELVFSDVKNIEHIRSIVNNIVTSSSLSNYSEISIKFLSLILPILNPDQKINSLPFWNNPDVNNAKFVWDYASKINQFDFIWNQAKYPTNLLVGEIIKLAIEKNEEKFFSSGNPFMNLKYSFVFIDEDLTLTKITQKFIEFSSIQEQILQNKEFDFLSLTKELYFIISNASTNDLLHFLALKLNEVTKEKWQEEIIGYDQNPNSYSSYIVLAKRLKDKYSHFQLKTFYCDALEQYLINLLLTNTEITQDIQNKTDEFLFLLDPKIQTFLKKQMSGNVINNLLKIESTVFFSFLPYFDIDTIVRDHQLGLQSAIKTFLSQEPNLQHIKMIVYIFENTKKTKFTPGDDFKTYIHDPIIKLLNSSISQDIKDLIIRLAKKIKVDLG